MNKQINKLVGKTAWLGRDVVVAVFAIFIVAVGVFGVRLPWRFPVQGVGAYELGVFESGLGLSSFDRGGAFYTISPVNDFYLDDQGERQGLLSWGELEAIKGEQKGKVGVVERVEKLRDVVEGFFVEQQQEYMVEGERAKLKYVGRVEGNELLVHREAELGGFVQVRGQGMTLGYEQGDVVFDEAEGLVYSDGFGKWREVFERVYGLSLKEVESGSVVEIVGGEVSVVNPELAGIIKVKAREGQKIRVDSDYRLIEVVEEVGSEVVGRLNMEIDLEVVDGIGRRNK